jgi:hypothetical protein
MPFTALLLKPLSENVDLEAEEGRQEEVIGEQKM